MLCDVRLCSLVRVLVLFVVLGIWDVELFDEGLV